jgi:membrane protein YqaA with SNARE-associated domain
MQIYQQLQEILADNTFQDYGIIGLFLNSFLSATAIPLPTEILTSALLLGGESQILVGIALVLGSTIGGVLNYFIGFGGNTLLTKFKKKSSKES